MKAPATLTAAQRRRRSTPASSSSASRAASPATRSATTATTVRGRTSPTSARSCSRRRSPRRCVNPTAPMPSFKSLAQNSPRSSRTSSASFRAAVARLAPMTATHEAGARRGTLEEPQVRAMFDRIAGFYDRMNTVMTAGLHHAWRRRAADLRARSARRPRARRRDRDWRPGARARPAVGPGGEVVGTDFSERMLELARAKARDGDQPRSRFEPANALALPYRGRRVRRRHGRLRRAQLLRSRAAGCARWRASCGPGGRVVVLEITTPQRPPLSTFFELWFDRVVPALGRLAGDPEAYSYLPSSVRRFPGPERARGADVPAAGWSRFATSSPPAGSSRCTWARSRRERRAVQPVVDAGGARRRRG